MRKIYPSALTAIILLSLVTAIPLSASASDSPVQLTVLEWYNSEIETPKNEFVVQFQALDDSLQNPYYELLGYRWFSTASYWINPVNKYGLTQSAVVTAVTESANVWDSQTSSSVFSYSGITAARAGKRDGRNVVAFGSYRKGVIAVTYLWSRGGSLYETDVIVNQYYSWSTSGEAGKMDLKNIMTHEFGHWCGLDDLYAEKDYWLTMYGYSDYAETYKQTLGLGDINGLIAVYGP